MANTVTIYGIKNCDTMMKARGWLDGRGVAYAFNDDRIDGISATGSRNGPVRSVGKSCSTAHRRPSARCPTGTAGSDETKAISR